jgi:hypothetical protein
MIDNPSTEAGSTEQLLKDLAHFAGANRLVGRTDTASLLDRCAATIRSLAPEPAARLIEDEDGAPVSQAAHDVIAERSRQISKEGWTPEHDDQHKDRSMALAAACYAMFASVSDAQRKSTDFPASLTTSGKTLRGWSAWLDIWPWDRMWWKPKDRRADLVRAGALILAEIERLDRLSATKRDGA